MKIKTFLIVLVGNLIILVGAGALVYSQLAVVRGINTDGLIDKLYKEDANIMSWAMQAVNPETLENMKLPVSWAELMLVDNGSLQILGSTNQQHRQQFMYKVPELLDQGQGIMAALQNNKAAMIGTKDYTVAIRPLEGNRSLIGFKPKAWEMQLIADQKSDHQAKTKHVTSILLIFLGIGTILALVVALVVFLTTGQSMSSLVKALEELSLGNLDVSPPDAGTDREVDIFIASFRRIKASLSMALERLGD
jgi:HAMP domain-containing protein